MASKISSATAWNNYQSLFASKPGEFKFTQKKPEWSYDDSDLKAYYDQLLNRKDFSFDLNNNALYNQYKDFYTKQGNLAMMDTIGQASSMTGGYGNSYAASAGQQAYQQNLDKLGEIVPEVYNLALQQYQLEGENLYNKYALAKGEKDSAYSQFVDSLNQYYTEYDMAYQQHSDRVDNWYSDVDKAYNVYGDTRDYEYNEARDAVKDSQWLQEFEAEQAARDKEYQMWLKEFEADQERWEKEYNKQNEQWEKEYNAKHGDSKDEPDESKVDDTQLTSSETTLRNKIADVFIDLGIEDDDAEMKSWLDFYLKNGAITKTEYDKAVDWFLN